jgi:hypothetical protein
MQECKNSRLYFITQKGYLCVINLCSPLQYNLQTCYNKVSTGIIISGALAP